MGMHDQRVDAIVFNAFNGFGDTTGEDDFGLSAAWIDLDDFVEVASPQDLPSNVKNETDAISKWLKTYTGGKRWVVATINSQGIRDAKGFNSKNDMMKAYNQVDKEYSKWLNQ